MENNGVFNSTNYNDISGTNGNERVINTNVNYSRFKCHFAIQTPIYTQKAETAHSFLLES